MFTFTLLLLPLAILFYYITSENKSNLLLITIGVLTGALICACKAFFSFSHRIIPYSFTENFLFFFLRETLIPMAVLYIVFILISRDTKEFKITAFFPLVSAFYAVYLPYIITSSPQAKSIFSIFVKPFLFLAMILAISIFLKMIFLTEKPNPVKIILGLLGTIIYIAAPAIIETMWILNMNTFIWILSSVVITCIPFAISILSIKVKMKKNME